MVFRSVNPATGEVLREYATSDPRESLALLARVQAAYERWQLESFQARAELLGRLASLLTERAEAGARLMALEMGKPLAEGVAEMKKCAWVCSYYAQHGEAFLRPETIAAGTTKSYVTFEPLGPVLAIMPWNFPFWQVFRFAAPALMAGNTVLLKHAPNVTGCALMIEEIFRDAGFPPGVLSSLIAELDVVAEVIGRPEIRAVTLTGSTRAGKAVGELAGRHLKKVVLELGGSDPYLILADADIDAAAEACVTSRLINGGQSCIAAKRFIVDEKIAAPFTEAVQQRMKTKTFGDPLKGTYDLGPLAREDLRQELHRQVTESLAAGAQCLLGGNLPEGPGYFYPPTLLTQVPEAAPAFCEELFGPVAAVIAAKDEADAVRLANQSDFGLGAAVFTGDLAKGEHIAAKQLNAGACFVNGFVRSDPRLPFGGIKDSGYGRELSSFGIREFVNVKTVWIG